MSQYIYFFTQHNNDFIRLVSYSRSNIVYEYFSDAAPYTHIRKLSKDFLDDIAARADADLLENKECLTRYKKKIQSIEKYNNSLDEKMDAISDIEDYMDETRETIKDLNFLQDFIMILVRMMEEDLEIYLGVEISHPTVDDLYN